MKTEPLIAFVLARLAEQEHTADLFHEAPCTRDDRCRCPVPRQILDHVGAKVRIVHTYADQLNPPDTHAPDWPIASIYAWQTLGSLALPHELHPHWQEHWRP